MHVHPHEWNPGVKGERKRNMHAHTQIYTPKTFMLESHVTDLELKTTKAMQALEQHNQRKLL